MRLKLILPLVWEYFFIHYLNPYKIILKEEADNKLKDTHSESMKQPKHQKQQSTNEEQYVDEEICNDGITHDSEESSTKLRMVMD